MLPGHHKNIIYMAHNFPPRQREMFHVEIIQLMRQNFFRLARLQGEKSLTFFIWKISFPSPSTCAIYFFYDHRKVCARYSSFFSFWIIFTDSREKMREKMNRDRIRAACFGLVKIYEDWRWNIKKENPCCEKKIFIARWRSDAARKTIFLLVFMPNKTIFFLLFIFHFSLKFEKE